MTETTDLQQRVERLFWNYNSPKDLSQLSKQKLRELSDYSVKELYGNDFQRARQILKAIGTPYLSTVLGNEEFKRVYDIITNTNKKHKAKDTAMPLEQSVESLFSSYSSPEDLSDFSDYKLRGLSSYASRKLYNNDFLKSQEILEEIGSMALPSLFNVLEHDSLNRVYDTIINIAKKHNAGDDVARQVAGKLRHEAVRSKGLNLMIEIGGSLLFLIYALGNKSDNGYAEEMLRGLYADERYTDRVNYELGKTLNHDYFYKDVVRERAKGILNTL